MATAIIKTTMDTLNSLEELTWTAATANDDALAEEFTFTPTGKRFILILDTSAGATAVNPLTLAFSAGTLWAGKAVSVTPAKDKIYTIEVDTARVAGAAGLVTVTVTPGAGDKLVGDHAAQLAVIDLI